MIPWWWALLAWVAGYVASPLLLWMLTGNNPWGDGPDPQ